MSPLKCPDRYADKSIKNIMKEFALIFRLSNEISKYHLEAGIAYWHTNPT
jgi:hypothetical protein